ncbi:hypothetical protein GE300_00745 [Rhodobacteraceae bacterium 2CG4]|uniref:Cysteine desulfurase n=1 Tax=Halovulum marinum TaxID=2662447 RepID=A0A6L5YVQ5_9RHOB|nr:hypothetical protein [Halovulum marinum]MSU88140.1 hypothetical protein [Halovulum marinum]
MIDIDRVRADTPGCAHGVHVDNAGAALMLDPVLAAVRAHLDHEPRVGGCEAPRRAAPALDAF